MYGENTKTIAIPIYRVLLYPVIQCLPCRKLFTVFCVTEELLLSDRIPCRIALLVRDLEIHVYIHNSMHNNNKKQGFVHVLFHNKDMDNYDKFTINTPQ